MAALIPWQYVPKRMMTLYNAGEINKLELYACAMFVYFERNDWLMWSIGSNFPTGYKVQTSCTVRDPRLERVFPTHEMDVTMMRVLRDVLIAELPFKQVAFRDGNRITRHRAGKRLFREMLGNFAGVLKGVDERVSCQ